MIVRHRLLLVATLLAGLVPGPARAQAPRWDASLELDLVRVGSVEHTAVGGGLRLAFRIADWLAADAGVVFAPGDLGEPAFSGGQTELLAGLRAGPRPDPFGVFATLRAGNVRFAEAPEPLACIAIFPPPLTCRLAQGHDALTVQVGAGAERLVRSRGVLRLEIGDRAVKLPGPSFDANKTVHDRDFWSHELRLTLSAGLRF